MDINKMKISNAKMRDPATGEWKSVTAEELKAWYQRKLDERQRKPRVVDRITTKPNRSVTNENNNHEDQDQD